MNLDGPTAIKPRSHGPSVAGALPALTIAAHPDPARYGVSAHWTASCGSFAFASGCR